MRVVGTPLSETDRWSTGPGHRPSTTISLLSGVLGAARREGRIAVRGWVEQELR
jgi:hypothetical protein